MWESNPHGTAIYSFFINHKTLIMKKLLCFCACMRNTFLPCLPYLDGAHHNTVPYNYQFIHQFKRPCPFKGDLVSKVN